MDAGVIVGTDRELEWLLPWWWRYYSYHNSFPVTFIDFGMSKKALRWCKERGTIIAYPTTAPSSAPIAHPSKLIDDRFKRWCSQEDYSKWRHAVFKKPVAMTLSPYNTTVWIDIDCEICGSIANFFQILTDKSHFAVAKWPTQNPHYNSGVVVFKKNTQVIQEWIDTCITQHAITDDWALTHLIQSEKLSITELPLEWNWFALWGRNPCAIITHWASSYGKQFIKKHNGFQEYINLDFVHFSARFSQPFNQL